MLVDYSDSEDEEQEPVGAPAPSGPSSAPAPPEPPAKRARKEINLQALLQKHDVSLPFEAASKLPANFFDSAPAREEDVGESEKLVSGKTGWAALSSLLPPPKNAAKVTKASTLYANAKPLNSTAPRQQGPSAEGGPSCVTPSAGSSSAAAASSSSAHATDLLLGPPPPSAHDVDEPDGFGSELPEAGGGQASTLRPRVVTDMYADVGASSAPTAAYPQSAPGGLGPELGPAMGPAMGPSLPAAGANGYGEMGYVESYPEVPGEGVPDLSEGKVLDVSQADLRKALGSAKQYEFTPVPKQEVQIAASFFNRKTGAVEAQYQTSSLQKRKHQINSLASDAAQQAAVVAAQGAKSNKSKAQTAAKYGW